MTNVTFFCEKSVRQPEESKEDKIKCYKIEEDPDIREVVRNLEAKHIGKRIPLSETNPKNSSVTKWIKSILTKYPEIDENLTDDLLNSFRAELSTRSKEKEKGVGILLLNDTLLLVHFCVEPSLARHDNKAYTVKLLLNPKNIYRAVIVRVDSGAYTLSAYEYNRKLTKGLAEFLGIEPEEISWDSTGTILLEVELEKFPIPVNIPLETEDLEDLFKQKNILPTGVIKIGQETGKVTKAQIFGRTMEFSQFYDYYITHTEKLEEYKNKFNDIIKEQGTLQYDFSQKNKFHFEEDSEKVYEITTSGKKEVIKKSHPRFTILFSTYRYPGIKPHNSLLWRIYKAIFENNQLEIWHSGEASSEEAVNFGNLQVYNKLSISESIKKFLVALLNHIQDSSSKKVTALLKYQYCQTIKNSIKNNHIISVFDLIQKEYIIPELISEFSNDGFTEKEDIIELKSADDVKGKPTKFVKETLVPTVKKYIENSDFNRYCIIYGFEDNTTIKPIYHLKNDQITTMESVANDELKNENISLSLYLIPYNEQFLLSVFILPKDKTPSLN